MRHKLYKAISKAQENVVLSSNFELDPSYTRINLKGTSHHKICIVSAIDENDNMLFKIGGLGRESFKILNQYRKYFSDNTKIISDDSHSIQTFVSKNGFRSDYHHSHMLNPIWLCQIFSSYSKT